MIKALRIKSGMTQENMSIKLGVDRSTVAKWETGRCSPRADMLIKLAGILNCTVDELLKEETEGNEE